MGCEEMKVQQQKEAALNRLDGLDGLRGIAMLMVIAVHLHLFSIGWTGLSSFFVLSGFLITRILLRDVEKTGDRAAIFRKFYVRRAFRILPLYYSYLFIVLLVTLVFPGLEATREALPSAFLYYYNIHTILDHSRSNALGHLWSLSVEEQFYIFWPWVIIFLPRERIRQLCIVIVILGPLIRYGVAEVFLPAIDLGGRMRLMWTYFFTLTHIDAFALGALLNFYRPQIRDLHIGLFIVAFLVIGIMANLDSNLLYRLNFGWPLFMPRSLQYIWGYSLVNLLWFLVIAAILCRAPLVSKIFTNRTFDYFGKRSYSTYVLHFPVLGVTHSYWDRAMDAFGRVPGTLLYAIPYLIVVFTLAGLSFRYLEEPMNNMKDRLSSGASL